MADMVEQRFWTVLPYALVRELSKLRISPLGVIPQRDRRHRVIADYTYSKVNAETICNNPPSMQFGHTLWRLLYRIHHANVHYGPTFMIKVDLADGFYRVGVATEDIPTLAVAFPNRPDEPKLVALPLVLPMGWQASPPYFCSVTETITDLTNAQLNPAPTHTPDHRLSYIADHPDNEQRVTQPIAATAASNSTPPARNHIPIVPHKRRPLQYVDIYVDDFVVLAQGNPSLRNRIRNTLFHTIDTVLRPLEPADATYKRKEPISVKKLNKGDAKWGTRKIILGWLIDTYRQTIELPPHRAQRLHEILHDLLHKRRISLSKWQKSLGELQSMVLALPGGNGLFSTLYTAFGDRLSTTRLRLTRPIQDAIQDLIVLADDLTSRPTRIGEIVCTLPVTYGTADASGQGMGGVWLSADPTFQPTLWRTEFPRGIQSQLVSTDNPNGKISNSDLELAGQIAAQDIIVQIRDCRERTLSLFTDNVCARSWQRKGSVTTLGPPAYLLRVLALHRRHYRYCVTFDYLPGPANVMADDASRLWHFTDHDLLTHFNVTYPQSVPWTICTLRPEMTSAIISALSRQRCKPASYLPAVDPGTLPGFDGKTIADHYISLRSAMTSQIYFQSSKSLPTNTVPANLQPVKNLSELVPWKGPSAPLARRYPYWGPPTPDSITPDDHTIYYNNNYEDTSAWMPQPPE